MNLGQMLQQTGAIDSMARELGVSPDVAKTAAGALLPAIVAGLGRNQFGAGNTRSSSGGLGDVLGSVLGGAGGGGAAGDLGGIGGVLLDQVIRQDPTPTAPGNDILGQIFGSKDVSRGVAEEVAGSTGLPADLLKKMLPILAMAVVGYMLKGKSDGAAGGSPLGGALGGILGQVVTGMMRR